MTRLNERQKTDPEMVIFDSLARLAEVIEDTGHHVCAFQGEDKQKVLNSSYLVGLRGNWSWNICTFENVAIENFTLSGVIEAAKNRYPEMTYPHLFRTFSEQLRTYVEELEASMRTGTACPTGHDGRKFDHVPMLPRWHAERLAEEISY